MASIIKGKHLSIYTIFPNSLYKHFMQVFIKSLTVTESIQTVWAIVQNFDATSTQHFTEEVENPLASSSTYQNV